MPAGGDGSDHRGDLRDPEPRRGELLPLLAPAGTERSDWPLARDLPIVADQLRGPVVTDLHVEAGDAHRLFRAMRALAAVLLAAIDPQLVAVQDAPPWAPNPQHLVLLHGPLDNDARIVGLLLGLGPLAGVVLRPLVRVAKQVANLVLGRVADRTSGRVVILLLVPDARAVRRVVGAEAVAEGDEGRAATGRGVLEAVTVEFRARGALRHVAGQS
mmetsp:Transcript_21522/g.43369  ORF Transcript_21522/g.43369 Transcript_21522/m.43369 type:complete len:215 (+) Transcript_21522:382-1026(+)